MSVPNLNMSSLFTDEFHNQSHNCTKRLYDYMTIQYVYSAPFIKRELHVLIFIGILV